MLIIHARHSRWRCFSQITLYPYFHFQKNQKIKKSLMISIGVKLENNFLGLGRFRPRSRKFRVVKVGLSKLK